MSAPLTPGHAVCALYLRERPLQPAASRADDLPQRTEHLTQEVLHGGGKHTVNAAQRHPTVGMQYQCFIANNGKH